MTGDTGYDPYNSAARWTWFDYATTDGGRYRRWVRRRELDELAPQLPPTAPPTTLPP